MRNNGIDDFQDKSIINTSTINKGFLYHALNIHNDETNSNYSYLIGNKYTLIPTRLDIFRNINNKIKALKDEQIKKMVIEFVNTFYNTLNLANKYRNISNVLPAISLNENDDDSVLLEWNFKNFRIGFQIDKEPDDSYWFLVTNKNLEEFNVSGDIRRDGIDNVIIKILKYVLENT